MESDGVTVIVGRHRHSLRQLLLPLVERICLTCHASHHRGGTRVARKVGKESESERQRVDEDGRSVKGKSVGG